MSDVPPFGADHRGDHDSWARIEATLLAGALTARPQNDDDRFPTLTPTQDMSLRLETARAIEKRLDEFQKQFPPPTGAEHERRLLEAVDAGDYDQMRRLGLDAGYAWLDVVFTALLSGAPFVEIETVGPYAAYHRDESGHVIVSDERIPADERAGIMLASAVRAMVDECANARIVSLFDDVNDPLTGTDIDEGDRLKYVVDMSKIFYREGVLRADDVPGRDYVLLRESSSGERIGELIDRLRHGGAGAVEDTADGDVTFWPARPFVERLALISTNRSREFTRRGILLRRRGWPTCQALEAAGFLDSHNRHVVHLLVLDAKFAAQQDKTYTLLRALGIVRQDTHHTVFYDSQQLSPETIVRVVSRLFHRELRRIIAALELVGSESQQPPAYVRSAPVVDLTGSVATLAATALADVLGERRVAAAADIGADIGLKSAQLVAPYVADHGKLTLIQNTRVRCEQLEGVLRDLPEPSRLTEIIDVQHRSVFDLAEDAYDLVTSFVGPDTITTGQREFGVSVRVLVRAMRLDGVLIVTRLVRSQAAPSDAVDQATDLSVDDVSQACRKAGLIPILHLAAGPTAGTAIALVVARRGNQHAGRIGAG